MKLSLAHSFVHLDGTKNTKEDTMANTLAIALFNKAKFFEPIKAHEFALKLHREQEIEIDKADCEILVKEIEATEYPIWARAQLLEAVKAAKEAPKEVKKK